MAMYNNYRRPMRRSYRRQYRPKFVRTSTNKSKGNDQASVYRDPHSLRTSNPKIPDGKCRLSAGIRLQSVKEWTNDANSTMGFVIFPGLNNAVYVDNTSTSEKTQEFSAHGGLTFSAVAPDEGFTQADSTIAKWRQVSLGAKFTLVNNADENDGWFEAIRFTSSLNDAHFIVEPGDGVIKPQDPDALQGSLPVLQDGFQMVEHPSYITGKLRDIHRYCFNLMPHDTDHDFQHLKKFYPTTTTSEEMEQDFVDHSYDMIYVRIHGRVSDGGGGGTPTRVMLHVVSNQEIMYEPATPLSRFHTETDSVAYFDRMKRMHVESNPKAGIIRSYKRAKIS